LLAETERSNKCDQGKSERPHELQHTAARGLSFATQRLRRINAEGARRRDVRSYQANARQDCCQGHENRRVECDDAVQQTAEDTRQYIGEGRPIAIPSRESLQAWAKTSLNKSPRLA